MFYAQTCASGSQDTSSDKDGDDLEMNLDLDGDIVLGDVPPLPDVPQGVESDDDMEEVSEDENEDEILDYGYELDTDAEDVYDNEEDKDENPDLGPEDGEEVLNYDMETLDEEGYGILWLFHLIHL